MGTGRGQGSRLSGKLKYHELEQAHRKEVATHRETRHVLIAVQVTAIVLLALLIGSVLLWWLVLR